MFVRRETAFISEASTAPLFASPGSDDSSIRSRKLGFHITVTPLFVYKETR